MPESEESVNEKPRAEEAAEDAPAAEEAPAEAAESQEELSPKERRRRARAAQTAEPRPQRSVEERAQERAEERRRKARHRRAYRQRMRERRRSEAAEVRGRGPEAPPAAPKSTGRAKTRQGVVVSDRADKTITVRVDVVRQHRMYGKVVRTSSTLHVHDERNEAGVGDTVRVVESRPISRTKRWRLVEVMERAR
jgi:small subunit ribosomal protein S17